MAFAPPGSRALVCLAACLLAAASRTSMGYVDLAPTIAKIIGDSKTIALVEVTSLDEPKGALTLKELKVLKGQRGDTPLMHQVAPAAAGTGPATLTKAVIPRPILQWAQLGAQAIVFSSARTAIVCIGPAWYELRHIGDPWKLGPDRPELTLAYYGSVSRLAEGLDKMLTGGDAVLTVLPHAGDRNASFDFSLNRLAYPGLIRVERLRANLKMPGFAMAVSGSPNYLIGLGPVDLDDLPNLVRVLDTGDAEARAAAADDIRQLTEIVGAAKTRSAVGALEKRLGDPVPRTRALAAAAILRITHGHEGALKVLADGLAGPVEARRDFAGAAAVIGQAGAPLVAALAGLLQSDDNATRFAALQALGTLGPVAAGARDAVVPLLENSDYMIDAADALGRMGPKARPVPPRMVKMLLSSQDAVRQAAIRGMAQIGGREALPAADYIASEIGTMGETDAFNMIELLAFFGPIASEPASRIKSIPAVPNFIITDATNWAINAPGGFPWLSGSTEVFGDVSATIYASYVQELGERLRPCALALAPKLMAGEAGDVPEWGYRILNAAPDESIGTIAPHLSDGDKALRERAAIILARMGPPAGLAAKLLQAAIGRASDERERRLLEWALSEITRD